MVFVVRGLNEDLLDLNLLPYLLGFRVGMAMGECKRQSRALREDEVVPSDWQVEGSGYELCEKEAANFHMRTPPSFKMH
jgi:hypothetical protein